MQTRRSTRNKRIPPKLPEDRSDDEEVSDNGPEEEPRASSKITPRAAKELKRKSRGELRSRNMGLGLSIPSHTEESTPRKHTMFDEDESNTPFVETKSAIDENAKEEEEEEDDDDDAVEEVKSNFAREQSLQQRAIERATADISRLHAKSKKRKKKTSDKNEKDEVEEEFDDDFFAQIDSEMASNREQTKEKDQGSVKGKHTAFISAHDDAMDEPIQANNNSNIELVVLGGDDKDSQNDDDERLRTVESKLGTEPSEKAVLFSRSALLNGSDGPNNKIKTKKTSTRKKQDDVWKRSKKTNRLAVSGSRVHRRTGGGNAAAHFVMER